MKHGCFCLTALFTSEKAAFQFMTTQKMCSSQVRTQQF